MTTGDNLSLASILCFRCPHRTIIANPFLNLSVVSYSRNRRFQGVYRIDVHHSSLQIPIGWGSSWVQNSQVRPLWHRHQGRVHQERNLQHMMSTGVLIYYLLVPWVDHGLEFCWYSCALLVVLRGRPPHAFSLALMCCTSHLEVWNWLKYQWPMISILL